MTVTVAGATVGGTTGTTGVTVVAEAEAEGAVVVAADPRCLRIQGGRVGGTVDHRRLNGDGIEL
jgi:hypothetical protein